MKLAMIEIDQQLFCDEFQFGTQCSGISALLRFAVLLGGGTYLLEEKKEKGVCLLPRKEKEVAYFD